MNLYYTGSHDVCVLKVCSLARYVGVEVALSVVTPEQMRSMGSKSMALVEAQELKSVDHMEMMSMLVEYSEKNGSRIKLNPSDDGISLRCNNDLEPAVQTLAALATRNTSSNTSLTTLTAEESVHVSLASIKKIHEFLQEMEVILFSQTYFGGDSIGKSDFHIYCSLYALSNSVEFGGMESLNKYTNVMRYFMTLSYQEFMEHALADMVTANAMFAASQGSDHSEVVTEMKRPIGEKYRRNRIRLKELLGSTSASESYIGQENVTVKGWIRTSRSAEKGALLFLEITDGSIVKGFQAVLSQESTEGFEAANNCGGVGASISLTGNIIPSPARGQLIEMTVLKAEVIGPVYGGDNGEIGGKYYPMSKKAHGLEYLREKAHLRPRSKMFSSAMRLRHAMAFATHDFFNKKGFVYVHTPLITGADCEGAGEMFSVTTLLPEDGDFNKVPKDQNGKIDYTKDFFGKKCAMTVSGQLNVETHACALSDVYTFGPTFRAENSHTSRHLAEFWMIEPEICFADLSDDMALAEDYVRYCTKYALEHCQEDLNYFENEFPAGEKGLCARLQNVVDNDFARITYTEAIDLLQNHIAEKKVKFEKYPSWGDDLGSEHERYITEKVYQKPTIVINYPKGIKAFYMKLNDDNETVAAMDILVPKIGELIGGSQREDDLKTLTTRAAESGVEEKDIWWYADLRKYGTVPHAGFGLGFERLVMFITGLENIRDVIPFPRVPGHAEF